MNLRWLFGNFADPEFNLTRREQHEVTRLAHRRHLSKTKLVLSTLAMTIAGWGLMWFGWEPLAGLLAGSGVRYARSLSIVIICIAVGVAAAWLYRFIYVRPVRLAMRDLGHDICVNCGYRLQGLREDNLECPECGAPRVALPKKATGDSSIPPAEPGAHG